MPEDGNAALVLLQRTLAELEAFNASLAAMNEQLRTGRPPRPQLRLVTSGDAGGERSS